jgi:hypothetical protein
MNGGSGTEGFGKRIAIVARQGLRPLEEVFRSDVTIFDAEGKLAAGVLK